MRPDATAPPPADARQEGERRAVLEPCRCHLLVQVARAQRLRRPAPGTLRGRDWAASPGPHALGLHRHQRRTQAPHVEPVPRARAGLHLELALRRVHLADQLREALRGRRQHQGSGYRSPRQAVAQSLGAHRRRRAVHHLHVPRAREQHPPVDPVVPQEAVQRVLQQAAEPDSPGLGRSAPHLCHRLQRVRHRDHPAVRALPGAALARRQGSRQGRAPTHDGMGVGALEGKRAHAAPSRPLRARVPSARRAARQQERHAGRHGALQAALQVRVDPRQVEDRLCRTHAEAMDGLDQP